MNRNKGIAVFIPKEKQFGIVEKNWMANGCHLDPLNEVYREHDRQAGVPKENLIALFTITTKEDVSCHDVHRLLKDWDKELKTAMMDRICIAEKQNAEIQTAHATMINELKQQISDLQEQVVQMRDDIRSSGAPDKAYG
jgi:hypothetical protein